MPSWPLEFRPQHKSAPEPFSPQERYQLADTDAQSLSPPILFGTLEPTCVPSLLVVG